MGKKSDVIHIPGVLSDSPEESFRVHNETCAEGGKRSHGGLPPAPNPTAGGQKRPLRTSKRRARGCCPLPVLALPACLSG